MLRLADVSVVVSDANSSARWWEEKVGFKTHTVGKPGGHAVVVAPPGERFLIHLCAGFENVDPGNTGIAFVTDQIEELVRRMEAAGVQFPEPLKKGSWGARAKFSDPDGNVFWLVEAPVGFIRQETGRRAPGSAAPKKRTRPSGRSSRENR
jgi:catechol 2,3-dioxygenase-like lactoylglutathione lyase family enzyme